MYTKNLTYITTIHFLGFQVPQNISFLIFCIVFVISCATVSGNLMIITIVSHSRTLHTPMYFFLSQLSVLDILLVMNILPTMLHTLLTKEAIISFAACITQFFIFAVLEALECLLLAVMSYDRYLAICKPLHYKLIMTHPFCWRIVIASWISGICFELFNTLNVLQLQYCGPNVIDHFFCDLYPILELSCTDTTLVQVKLKMVGAMVAVIPFFIIIVSYNYIVVTVLKILSLTARKKVFSTCSSHLAVVSIFYGTIVSVYLVPHKGQLRNVSKFLSLLYTVVTPLINPIIYSLRNKELKKSVTRLIDQTAF